MRSAIALLYATTALCAGSLNIPISKQKGYGSTRGSSQLPRSIHVNSQASKAFPLSLANEFYYYQAIVGFGENPVQEIPFLIDTGSSDLWTNTAENPFCNEPASDGGFNCSGITYDPSSSPTYHNLSSPFFIQYGDLSYAQGNLATDNINIAGVTVPNATFATATISNSSQSVFGIGFDQNEGNARIYKNGTVAPVYPNVPDVLKKDGLIARKAYSLWLNDVDAADGSLLFGGVDHAKYQGTLGLVPIYNYYVGYLNNPNAMRVNLNGVSVGDCPLATFNQAYLLDSGTSYAYMDMKIVTPMADMLNYTYNDDGPNMGYFVGNCSAPGVTYTLDFSGIKINVPSSDLLIEAADDNGNTLIIDGEPQCAFLAVGYDPTNPADEGYGLILGDVILRSMYVAYDLESYQIGIAQSIHNVTDSDIEAISTGIPGTSAPRYASNSTVLSVVTTYSIASSCKPTASSSTSSSSAEGSVSGSAASSGSKAAASAVKSTVKPTSAPPGASIASGQSTSGATGAASAISATSDTAAATETTLVVSTFTTTCSTPTTFSTNGKTYTVTAPTVLTITDCPCTLTGTKLAAESSAPTSKPNKVEPETEPSETTWVVSTFTTSCSAPTILSTNGKTYTVTEATVLTITDCPCTLTASKSSSGVVSSAGSASAADTASSIASEFAASESSATPTRTAVPAESTSAAETTTSPSTVAAASTGVISSASPSAPGIVGAASSAPVLINGAPGLKVSLAGLMAPLMFLL